MTVVYLWQYTKLCLASEKHTLNVAIISIAYHIATVNFLITKTLISNGSTKYYCFIKSVCFWRLFLPELFL